MSGRLVASALPLKHTLSSSGCCLKRQYPSRPEWPAEIGCRINNLLTWTSIKSSKSVCCHAHRRASLMIQVVCETTSHFPDKVRVLCHHHFLPRCDVVLQRKPASFAG